MKLSSFSLQKFYNLITFLFIICVVFGTTIPPIVYNMAIVLFIGVSFFFRLVDFNLYINKYVIWWLLVSLFIMFNISYSYYPENSLQFFIDSVVRLIIIFAFVQYTVTIKDIERVLKYLRVSGLIVVGYAFIIERSTFLDYGLGNSIGNGRIFFSYIVIFSTMIYMYELIKKPSASTLLLTAFLYFACFLSMGRKSVIIPLVFLFVLLLIRSRHNLLKFTRNITFFGIASAFVYYLSFNVPFLYNLFGIRFEGLINSLLNTGGVDESTSIRSNMVDYGLSMFVEKPIFGYGADTFKTISHFNVYSHNNFVETMFSGGLIFLIIYYSFHFMLILTLVKRVGSNVAHADFFLAFIVALLAFDLGSISYFIYTVNFLLCMAASLCDIGVINNQDRLSAT